MTSGRAGYDSFSLAFYYNFFNLCRNKPGLSGCFNVAKIFLDWAGGFTYLFLAGWHKRAFVYFNTFKFEYI